MRINAPLTPDFAFFSFFIGFGQLFCITVGRFTGKYHALITYICLVIIPYIYIVFIRGYFIRKDFMLDEFLLHVNFKCITDDNLGKIINKVSLYQRELALENKYNLVQKRYYVSSRMVSKKLTYFGITLSSTDFEISDYELWKKIKIGSMYRLKYYKYDKSRIILQIDKFKYLEKLNKYLINDLSNLIVEYLYIKYNII